jgi:hypothetical protein
MRVALCAADAASRDEIGRAVAAWLPTCEPVWRASGRAVEGDVALVPSEVGADPEGRADLVDALRAFARAGGAVLGVGDGAGLLCTAGLLPGAVLATPAASPPRRETHLRVEGRATPFTWAIPAGRILPRPDVTRALVYAADAEALSATHARGGIVLRHCDVAGGVAPPDAASVAGWCDEAGRVVGIVGALELVPAALESAFARQITACLVSPTRRARAG